MTAVQGATAGSSSTDLGMMTGTFVEHLMRGDRKAVEALLMAGTVNVNEGIDGGPTALVLAIIKQDLAMAEVLLKNKANPDKLCMRILPGGFGPFLDVGSRTSPLQFAIESGNASMVNLLLNYGANMYLVNGGLPKLLLFAVKVDNYNLAKHIATITNNFSEWDNDDIMPCLSESMNIAITHQDIRMVKLLILCGARLNKEYDHLLPLTKAACTGNIQMCKVLMSFGAHLDGKGTTTPLSCAISTGLEDAIPVLIKLGSHVNTVLKWSQYSDSGDRLAAGSSHLHLAISRRKYVAARHLIEARCNMNLQDSEGDTPLHIAARDTASDSTKFLLEYALPQIQYFKGVKPGIPKSRCSPRGKISGLVRGSQVTNKPSNIVLLTTRNMHGRTALMEAVIAKNVTAVRLLVEPCRISGALNLTDNNGFTALHHAIEADHEEQLLVLLEGGIGVNDHVKPALTPLHLAVKRRRVNMVEILITYNADMTAVTVAGYSLLHQAVEANSLDLVTYFLAKGFDINVSSVSGNTPLGLAAQGVHHDIVQTLIDHGAMLDTVDHKCRETPLHKATCYGHMKIAYLLIREGASHNLLDMRSSTALDWCFFNWRPSILRLLIADSLDTSVTQYLKYPRTLRIFTDNDLLEYIYEKLFNPRSLQELCRIQIRRTMRHLAQGTGIVRWLDSLPLPQRLKDYLCYRTLEEGLNLDISDSELSDIDLDGLNITD